MFCHGGLTHAVIDLRKGILRKKNREGCALFYNKLIQWWERLLPRPIQTKPNQLNHNFYSVWNLLVNMCYNQVLKLAGILWDTMLTDTWIIFWFNILIRTPWMHLTPITILEVQGANLRHRFEKCYQLINQLTNYLQQIIQLTWMSTGVLGKMMNLFTLNFWTNSINILLGCW